MDRLANFFWRYKIKKVPHLIVDDKLNVEEIVRQIPDYIESMLATRDKAVEYYDGVLNTHRAIRLDDSYVVVRDTIVNSSTKYHLGLRDVKRFEFYETVISKLASLFDSWLGFFLTALVHSTSRKVTIYNFELKWYDEEDMLEVIYTINLE